MTVTPIYAGILGLLFLVLSLRVIARRRTLDVSLGDGDDRILLRRRRAHANCAEYVPIVLLLMTLAELRSSSIWLLHAIGLCLLLGRVLHATGVSSEPEWLVLRGVGMILTFTALAVAAVTVLLPSLSAAM